MFTQVQKLQLRNEVQRVLHVPGNYTGGILEMAIIIDHCLTKEQVKETVKEIVQTLKQTDQVFRNVRLNVIDWYSDDHFEKNVKGMPMLTPEVLSAKPRDTVTSFGVPVTTVLSVTVWGDNWQSAFPSRT